MSTFDDKDSMSTYVDKSYLSTYGDSAVQARSHRAARTYVSPWTKLWFCFRPSSDVALDRSYDQAADEARTRDPELGKLVLYQLSYRRIPANITLSTSTLLWS